MLMTGVNRVSHTGKLVVEDDGSLDGALVLHGLQALGPLIQLECLVDDSFDLYLARVEIVDSGG